MNVTVKPTGYLALMLLAGFGFLFAGTSALSVLGMLMLVTSIYSICMLPDRLLMQFTPAYAVLYNQRDRNSCSIVYWNEITNWQYEYHRANDRLVFYLVDGSKQEVDIYSKRLVTRMMKTYAPNKEIKNARIREVQG